MRSPAPMLIMLVILAIGYIAAWIMSMLIVTKAAKDKGYEEIQWQLWVIGLFGFIFTPPIIVAALPDKKECNTATDDLPAI